MKLKWDKYFYSMWAATLSNVGVVGTTWLTMNGLNGAGIDVPQMNLKSLGWSILVAGVFGALFSFWKTTPLPEIEDTTTITITKTKTNETPTEVKPPVDPPVRID